MGISRNRVPFNVWKWSEELKVLNLEDFSFSEYLTTNILMDPFLYLSFYNINIFQCQKNMCVLMTKIIS